jgi:hypothetical protein
LKWSAILAHMYIKCAVVMSLLCIYLADYFSPQAKNKQNDETTFLAFILGVGVVTNTKLFRVRCIHNRAKHCATLPNIAEHCYKSLNIAKIG